MIALRGLLQRTKKESPDKKDAPNKEGTPQQPTTTTTATGNSGDAYEWTWQGDWAFGSKLPDDPKKLQKFIYKWEQPVDPEDILVISLNYADGDEEEEEDNENAEEVKSVVPDNNSSATIEAQVAAEETTTGTTAKEVGKSEMDTITAMDIEPKSTSADAATTTGLSEDKANETAANDISENGAKKNASKMDAPTGNDSEAMDVDKDKPVSITLDKNKDGNNDGSSAVLSAPPQVTKDKSSASVPESEDAKVSNGNNKNVTTGGSAEKGTSKPETKVKFETTMPTTPKIPKKRPKITFATTDVEDPPFTDASIKHPGRCPPGGHWKGHFENAIKPAKKSKQQQPVPLIQKIAETFHLFFNVTPASDAQTWFPTEELQSKIAAASGDNDAVVDGLLKKGQIHARGTGENQFGTFELLGSFDVETGMLECQRMYVTNLVLPTKTPKRRRSSSAQGLAEGQALVAGTTSKDGNDGRPYFTRKRPMSWKRKASFGRGGDSDSDGDGNTPMGSARKKSAAPGSGANATKRVRVTEPKAGEVSTAVAPGAGISIAIPPVTGKRPGPSPKGTPRGKKSSSSGGGNTTPRQQQIATPAVSTSTTYMKLPSVGDPKQAHWRSAHYLYYQKNDPSQDEGGGNSHSGSSGTPAAGNAYKYVVYEGEMFKSQREGRGVCLFSNQMIYEGEWRRNKEHGKGTLMTSDRKRIIYQGDWERGRMHGRGVFYYSSGVVMNAKQQVVVSDDGKGKRKGGAGGGSGAEAIQSRYEGDFKENLRHGLGKYVLPDGSEYDGMWREGMMCGRGTFTWSDGSIYEGDWKDGQRHGSGLLRSSDGFRYDGMWVKNAMEGRGSAVYPNGQTYNGLFSDGKREGRGTIHFTNGAVYEGRFRDDKIDGQGTMKILKSTAVPREKPAKPQEEDGDDKNISAEESTPKEVAKVEEKEAVDKEADLEEELKPDFLIPLSFQSDMGHIHMKAGFTLGGE